MSSPFFAYLSKLRWVLRWGMKRNVIPENVMEHSWEVATIAHALALIHNHLGESAPVNADRVAAAALYHDASEAITGDMPSPVKYHSEAIKTAYKAIEAQAEEELVALLPASLRDVFADYMHVSRLPALEQTLIKAADTIAAYIKCQAELAAGNQEFVQAEQGIAERLAEYDQAAVTYFLDQFLPSYRLTLDELLLPRSSAGTES